MTPPECQAESAFPPTLGLRYRYISCEKCGKRMLVEIVDGTHHHRCPVCQAEFVTRHQSGQLEIVFPAQSPGGPTEIEREAGR